MYRIPRRQFLNQLLAGMVLGPNLSFAAGWKGVAPLPNGHLEGLVPFEQEGDPIMEKLNGAGLDGRLYSDLTKLQPDAMLLSTDRFYVRTSCSTLLHVTDPWKIHVGGLVKHPTTVTAAAIDAGRADCGNHVMECSGNGSHAHFGMLSCAPWEGIPLNRVLEASHPLPAGTRVLVSGFDEYPQPSRTSQPGASWIFTREDAAGAFLVTRMNHAPLTRDHGFPVRLLVPNWYGCCSIKWVNEIKLVDDSELATAQMLEFAGRTEQTGTPTMAREYQPAVMDLAAMPVRLEKWTVEGRTAYRLVGIQWGAGAPTDKLTIRFAPQDAFRPVESCQVAPPGQGWWLWSHVWRPRVAGIHAIQLMCADTAIRTRRLQRGFYTRRVEVDAVKAG